MANELHLNFLKRGSVVWNRWREENNPYSSEIFPDLSGADLFCAPLPEANLSGADLSNSNLCRANLKGADLHHTNLSNVDLSYACLAYADLRWANLKGANLIHTNLKYAHMVKTNLEKADLTESSVYGISTWSLNLEGANQSDLIITPDDDPTITVDNLEVARFIYLLLDNKKIRDVIDTITSKMVLILGRFTTLRKDVLDAIREELRHCGYLPVLFDFEKPASRDITETISILAHMAHFVIADITDARSIPQELERIVPSLPSVPVQPLLQSSAIEYGMFEHFKRYPWVLELYQYNDIEEIITSIKEKIIAPAEAKVKELRQW